MAVDSNFRLDDDGNLWARADGGSWRRWELGPEVDGSGFGFAPGSRVRTYRIRRDPDPAGYWTRLADDLGQARRRPPAPIPAPAPLPARLRWTTTRLDQPPAGEVADGGL